MKTIIITIFCFAVFNSFAQTSEAITEEKSSTWIKVIEDPAPVSKPVTVKKQTNTSTKKPAATKPSTPKKETPEEFEKTNQQVNRFKKAKKE